MDNAIPRSESMISLVKTEFMQTVYCSQHLLRNHKIWAARTKWYTDKGENLTRMSQTSWRHEMKMLDVLHLWSSDATIHHEIYSKRNPLSRGNSKNKLQTMHTDTSYPSIRKWNIRLGRTFLPMQRPACPAEQTQPCGPGLLPTQSSFPLNQLTL